MSHEQESEDGDPGDVSEEDEATEIIVDNSMNDVEDFIGMQKRREERQREKIKVLPSIIIVYV